MVAAVRTATHNAMMLCDTRALLAKDAIRVQVVAKPFKTGGIVRELVSKIFLGVLRHLGLPFAKLRRDPETLADNIPTATG
jgi:hypothetical protein